MNRDQPNRCGRWPALVLLAGLLVVAVAGPGRAEELVTRTILKVEKITCGACLRVIDAELRKVPGILGMGAELATRRVTVDHDREVTAAEVAAAITAAGYPAQPVESSPLAAGQARHFQRDGFDSGAGCCNPGGSNPVADSWRELRRRFQRLRCGNGN